jgi:LPXTG-site transpeptidase (sortase) family protein
VIFSKPVTGFIGTDVTVSGTAGATTATVTGSGTTYNVAVSGMTNDGTVIASIPAGVATDAVGNTNAASSSTDNTVTYDTAGPTVTINQAAGQLDPTSATPIGFTVVFSEPVTGFTVADLNLGGTAGATTAVVTGTGTTYNVAVSGMTASGTVFVSITDSAAIDAAGNLSAASTSTDNIVTFDNGLPAVTINQAAGQADPTNTSPINFAVVFSKPVTGFTNADVVLTGTAGASTAVVTGTGTTYNVAVSGMAGSGTVIATIPADRAQDSAGNGNTASTSTDNTVTYDITAPAVTINQAAGQADPTNTSPINFTVEFSEPVFGFTSADITLGGTAGATSAVVTGSGATYNVAVSGMITDGTITAGINAAVVTDAAGNANTASTSTDNEVAYNTSNPTVTINQALIQTDPTNVSPINFTVVFSELVAGFTNSDVVITGTAGATTATVTGSGLTYNVAITGMKGDGTVMVSIPGGAVTDPSGNPNTPSSSSDNTVTYFDGIGPSVAVVNTTPDTGDGNLKESETVAVNITQFSVKFNQDVYNPPGDSDVNDVTNPNNYLLVHDRGDTLGFQTVNCSGGVVAPADTKITIGSVTYANNTATFSVNDGQPLPNGVYRLYICGSTSIVDPLNNALKLVGVNGAGSDFIRNFSVLVTSTEITPPEITPGSTSFIPVTGFAPGVVTTLPVQPLAEAYSDLGDLWLEIPHLGVQISIVGIPRKNGRWDVSWLSNQAGYLDGSAYPTSTGNSVMTAHVYLSNGKPGPFVNLSTLIWGDEIIIHASGKQYVYQVQAVTQVKPDAVSTMLKHEDASWLTLVTCKGYNPTTGGYQYRILVRAVLIKVK